MVPTTAHSGVGVMAETDGNGGNVLLGQVDTFSQESKTEIMNGQIPSFNNNQFVRTMEGSCENYHMFPVTIKPPQRPSPTKIVPPLIAPLQRPALQSFRPLKDTQTITAALEGGDRSMDPFAGLTHKSPVN